MTTEAHRKLMLTLLDVRDEMETMAASIRSGVELGHRAQRDAKIAETIESLVDLACQLAAAAD